MSSRACPDWPVLMELAPELQFKHYTAREAQLPVAALIGLDPDRSGEICICCDLGHHVFNPEHTDERLAEALRSSHWFDLREWLSRPPRGRTA